MKIEFLLQPEDGEQSEKKLNESLCSTRCCMAALQRGFCHGSHGEGIVGFILERSGLYPSSRALGRGPGGTLPGGHAGRYSDCYYPQANLRVETKS